MTTLEDALERSHLLIEEALVEARAELETVEARRRELLDQIARAEAILGGGPPSPTVEPPPAAPEGGPLTLHEAIARVLEDAGNEWMTARELADAVNRRGLYRKRDGSPVEVNQVHARMNNYTDLFEKNGPKIRLKEGARVLATQTPNVVMFKDDDDDGFFEWQDAHPEGQFINTERKPNPNYLVLHNSGCPHFKGADSLQWTKDYVKIASTDHHALERWAHDTVGGEITLCRTCFGH
jgi:hypothetical protein